MSSVTDLDKVFASLGPRRSRLFEEDSEKTMMADLTSHTSYRMYFETSTEAMRDIAEARKNMEENREKL